jgi:hypothetical protein
VESLVPSGVRWPRARWFVTSLRWAGGIVSICAMTSRSRASSPDASAAARRWIGPPVGQGGGQALDHVATFPP